jgi:hypothetical protein
LTINSLDFIVFGLLPGLLPKSSADATRHTCPPINHLRRRLAQTGRKCRIPGHFHSAAAQTACFRPRHTTC